MHQTSFSTQNSKAAHQDTSKHLLRSYRLKEFNLPPALLQGSWVGESHSMHVRDSLNKQARLCLCVAVVLLSFHMQDISSGVRL